MFHKTGLIGNPVFETTPGLRKDDKFSSSVQTMYSAMTENKTTSNLGRSMMTSLSNQSTLGNKLPEAHLFLANAENRPFYTSIDQPEFMLMRQMLREMKVFNIIPPKNHLEFANLFDAKMYGANSKLDTHRYCYVVASGRVIGKRPPEEVELETLKDVSNC